MKVKAVFLAQCADLVFPHRQMYFSFSIVAYLQQPLGCFLDPELYKYIQMKKYRQSASLAEERSAGTVPCKPWELQEPPARSSHCSKGSVCCHSNGNKAVHFWKRFLAEQVLDKNLKQDLECSDGAFYTSALFLQKSLHIQMRGMCGWIVSFLPL